MSHLCGYRFANPTHCDRFDAKAIISLINRFDMYKIEEEGVGGFEATVPKQ